VNELDASVVRALNYYRALVEAGKHAPGSEALATLRSLVRMLDAADREQDRSTCH
jgi:flagellar motor component MotA